jgi:ubiquinol-cytochrome c reductase cytochrome b subunit
MNAILNWLDDRTGYKALVHEALNEPIPGGAKWKYVWGSTLTFVFAVQLITGCFLWASYSPSTLTAWESVYYIQYVMKFGWLVRGIHHFAAQAMMILLGLHFMQVVIAGAYRAPREVNFWLGLVLMQIVLGLSLTGYLLPWDQKGYYATKVATNIVGVTPMIGPQLQQLAQGGTSYGHQTLTRFFALHAGILPGLLIAFLALHIYVFRRHGITVSKSDETKPIGTFWPDQVLMDAVACLAVLVTILGFTVWKGAELSGPADASEAYSAARPEWYFLFLFRFLKIQAIDELGLAFGAIYIPGLIMLIIALMPFIGRWKLGHGFNIGFTFVLLLGAGVLTGLAWKEDGENKNYLAAVRAAEFEGHRAAELAEEFDIPPTGALSLLKEDPLIQGPKLFKRHCAGCHRYNGHDGLEQIPMREIEENGKKKEVEEPATAADLGQFGSREWITSVLGDYHTTFAPLKNNAEKGERFLSGEMAGWSKDNAEALKKPENADHMKALAEFIVAQSGRHDLEPYNPDLVTAGKEVFKSGKLANGALSANCSDCHALTPADGSESLGDGAGPGYPTLTGYAGKEWLKSFIKNPGSDEFYGKEHNLMPAFEAKLSKKELDHLVSWMVGEYFRSSKHGSNGKQTAGSGQ